MNRRWLLLVAGGVFLWIVLSRMTELAELGRVLRQGHLGWLLAALGLQLLHFGLYALLYHTIFAVVGVRTQLLQLLGLTFAAVFVNVAVPASGMGGVALFVDDARRRGESAPRAGVGMLLAIIAFMGSLALLLPIALHIFRIRHALQPYQTATALIFIGTVVGLLLLLLIGGIRPQLLVFLLQKVQRIIVRVSTRLGRGLLLEEDWVARISTQYVSASQAIIRQPGAALRTLAVAFAAHGANLLTFFACFRAFGSDVTPDVVLAGYGIALMFWIISPAPQGVGFVESLTPAALVSLGEPAATATVVAFAFRGLSFWLPLGIGFLLLRRLHFFQPGPANVHTNNR